MHNLHFYNIMFIDFPNVEFFLTFLFPSFSNVWFFIGFWQLLDFDYLFKVVSDILNLIETKKWPLEGIPRIETLKALSENEPRAVVSQCFEYYLKPTGNITDEGKTVSVLK